MPGTVGEQIDVEATIDAAAQTASVGSPASVGLASGGYQDASVMIVAGAWTDGTHDFTLEVADDDGTGAPDTFASAPAGDINGTVPTIDDGADDNQVYVFDYTGSKPWVRVTSTVSGATTGAIYGVYVVKGNATTKPA